MVEISVFHLSVGLTDEHIYSSSSNDGKREYRLLEGAFLSQKLRSEQVRESEYT